MKLLAFLNGFLLFMFLAGCALINSSSDETLKRFLEPTEWEKANDAALENLNSDPLAVDRLLDNCISYTTYPYQKNLCTLMKQQVAQSKFTAEYTDNLRQVAVYFPVLPRLEGLLNELMIRSAAIESMVYAQMSRTVESFAKGYISSSELLRQLAQYNAVLKEYHKGPTFVDLLLGAGKILAEGASSAPNPTVSTPLAGGKTGFLKGERTQGFNKICFYDVLGTTYSINVGAISLCPLTYQF